MTDATDTQKEQGKQSYEEEFRSRLTHVLYCPECSQEIGRYDDIDEVADAKSMHHSGTGHDPGVITGVYR